jgi:hypothetical protein|tara:strand:+ start:109 stop:504 length:396 start_codon:yes stop_codon:yes gene_type:complete
MSQYSPFDYTKAINQSKERLMDSPDEMWEKKYSPFIVNKALYAFPDIILLVNEMNLNHHLDAKLQFDFLLNSIRPRKRYAPWLKTSKINNLELVKEYFGYNDQKAKDALDLLTDDQLEHIQTKLNKGGNAR